MGTRWFFIVILFFSTVLVPSGKVLAQNSKLSLDNEPLIPNLKNKEVTNDELGGINDPFQPKIKKEQTQFATNTQTIEEEPIKNEVKTEEENVEKKSNSFESMSEAASSIDIENSNNTEVKPVSSEEDPLAQELLNGNDEDFKPAPLKIDGNPHKSPDASEEKTPEVAAPVEEVKPVATPTPEAKPEVQPEPRIEETEKNEVEKTPPKSSITIPKDKNGSQVKTSDLITEEIDPWDDPRKQVSTTCRMHLERIKKKKLLLQRADGTFLRLQEAMVSAPNNKVAQMREVSSKLGRKVLDLKKELEALKEKTIRLGCPGVDY